jgi:serine protease DegQ
MDLATVSRSLSDVVKSARSSIVQVRARSSIPATGVVWSDDGVIVTADHAVEAEQGIEIGLPDGASTAATLVGRDPRTDVAVLRADAKGLTPPQWAERG